MKKIQYLLLPLLAIFFACSGFSQHQWKHGRLRVSADAHFLETTNGRPFFWLADTGWELFHRLTFEEIVQYLNDRHRKGFNVIQAVVLAEHDGLTKANRYSQQPLFQNDPLKPNAKYFQLIDTTIRMAAKIDMFVALLPTWGDKVSKEWGKGPVVFNERNAYLYGKWLGNRYRNDENIIWMLGGDRKPVKDSTDFKPIWRAMARGIQEATDYKAFITYHISGGESTSKYLHNEPWLNMNTMQSGHGSGHDVPVWRWIDHDFNLPSPKPTLDAEPNYEDHPVDPWPRWDEKKGYFNDYDVRKQSYRSVFAGGCGVTYGHHGVWQFYSEREEPITHADWSWTAGLDRPGAYHVGYLRKIMESRPLHGRRYDAKMIVEGQSQKNAEFITAFRGLDNNFAMIYMPVGKVIKIDTRFMKSSDIKIWFVDPRIGHVVRGISSYRKDILEIKPPTLGVGQDWVIVLDNPDMQYRPPME